MSYEFEILDVAGELVDDTPFFAPVAADLVNGLVGQYLQLRERIERMGEVVNGADYAGALHHFASGNQTERHHVSFDRMFEVKGAIGSLNSTFWSKALALTDILDAMPQKRRSEWHESIRTMSAPDFEENTVRTTIAEMLGMRAQFLAERVDGIFRALSGDHVTNVPEGFGKRMIVAGVTDEWGSTTSSRTGHINDLRAVVAKFMGRDEPNYRASESVIQHARRNHGQWHSVDGGALRIRVYMKGTAHLEVHPDMTWRLNSVLANLYPMAIPAQFRMKPAKRAKEFQMIARPLPFAVLNILADMRLATERETPAYPERYRKLPNTRTFSYQDMTSRAFPEALRIIESLGGLPVGNRPDFYQFDYDPAGVIGEVLASGCVPDLKAHQFYPSPKAVALAAVAMVSDGTEDDATTWCEPSAGQGGLADHLPKSQTLCVEIAALNCAVLTAKGYQVEQGDFIAWAQTTTSRFDRIVMNPPFSEGRARAHVQAAFKLLTPTGRLTSVLPASEHGKAFVEGACMEWTRPIENAFSGTGVAVVLMLATKA